MLHIFPLRREIELGEALTTEARHDNVWNRPTPTTGYVACMTMSKFNKDLIGSVLRPTITIENVGKTSSSHIEFYLLTQ